jgi:hypothetical protein
VYRRKLRLRLRLLQISERNDRDNPPTGAGKMVTTSRDKTVAPQAHAMPDPKGAVAFLWNPGARNPGRFRPALGRSALLQLSAASADDTA